MVVYAGALAVGFVSNRWTAAAIALAMVPAAMIGVALDGDEPVGDAGSGVVETGLLTLVFVVVPAAIVVCLGVLLRRGLSRMRRSASAA